MPRWISVPACPECGDIMREDDDDDFFECVDCGYTIYGKELDTKC